MAPDQLLFTALSILLIIFFSTTPVSASVSRKVHAYRREVNVAKGFKASEYLEQAVQTMVGNVENARLQVQSKETHIEWLCNGGPMASVE
jgi:hypothetical protein